MRPGFSPLTLAMICPALVARYCHMLGLAWEGVTVLMELYAEARESTGLVRVKQEHCDLGDGVTGWKVLVDNLDT